MFMLNMVFTKDENFGFLGGVNGEGCSLGSHKIGMSVPESFHGKHIVIFAGRDIQEGEEILEYRKNWTGELLDRVMSDYALKESTVVNTSETDELIDEAVTEE